ncbi:hypothetical protein JNW90_10620 [Micromonospora sp. STR1s_5]|nr:hypothetical protein [Micromonospora sp. STR1s_5]
MITRDNVIRHPAVDIYPVGALAVVLRVRRVLRAGRPELVRPILRAERRYLVGACGAGGGMPSVATSTGTWPSRAASRPG